MIHINCQIVFSQNMILVIENCVGFQFLPWTVDYFNLVFLRLSITMWKTIANVNIRLDFDLKKIEYMETWIKYLKESKENRKHCGF